MCVAWVSCGVCVGPCFSLVVSHDVVLLAGDTWSAAPGFSCFPNHESRSKETRGGLVEHTANSTRCSPGPRIGVRAMGSFGVIRGSFLSCSSWLVQRQAFLLCGLKIVFVHL